MKKFLFKVFLVALFALSVQNAKAEGNIVYLRGSMNNWAVSGDLIMRETYPGSNIVELKYLTVPSFTEIKFDVYGDWSYNFGDNYQGYRDPEGYYQGDQSGSNILISESGTYDIYFNKGTKRYSIVRSAEVPESKIKLYYKTGWDPANLLYSADGGSWIDLPGKVMDPIDGYTSYKYTEVDAFKLEFVLSNNGQGHFDNNEIVIGGGSGTVYIRNYFINFPGTWTLEDGVIKKGAPAFEISTLQLSVDKTEIKADNTEEVTFTTTIVYNNGTSVVTTNAVIYNGVNQLAGNTFKTDAAGEYTFTAKFGNKESNAVTVEAVDAERIPTSLVLTTNTDLIDTMEHNGEMLNVFNVYDVDGVMKATMIGTVYDQYGEPMEGIEIEFLCAHRVPFYESEQTVHVPSGRNWLYAARTKGLETNLESNIIYIRGVLPE